jgi:hypothetical protein
MILTLIPRTCPFDPYLEKFISGETDFYSDHIDNFNKVWYYLTVTKGIKEYMLDSTLDTPEEFVIEWTL